MNRPQRNRIARTISLVVALAAMTGGCLGLKQEYPDKRYFMLEAERSESAGAPAPSANSRPALTIRPFQSTPRSAGREFIYRVAPSRFKSDYYHLFFRAPEDIIASEARRRLEASGRFSRVATARSHADAPLMLEGVVQALYGDYVTTPEDGQEAAGRAVMALQFLLLNDEGGAPEVLFQKDYHATVALTDKRPETLVAAWNRALTEILNRLEKDLSDLP